MEEGSQGAVGGGGAASLRRVWGRGTAEELWVTSALMVSQVGTQILGWGWGCTPLSLQTAFHLYACQACARHVGHVWEQHTQGALPSQS